MHIIKKIVKFFDKLEDHVRGALSHYPILYTLIGGIAIVLFWRGVWMTADDFYFSEGPLSFVFSGPMSVVLSVAVLLITGLFVSFFVTDRIILTGLKQEKKMAEKAALELEHEEDILQSVVVHLESMDRDIQSLRQKINKIKK